MNEDLQQSREYSLDERLEASAYTWPSEWATAKAGEKVVLPYALFGHRVIAGKFIHVGGKSQEKTRAKVGPGNFIVASIHTDLGIHYAKDDSGKPNSRKVSSCNRFIVLEYSSFPTLYSKKIAFYLGK
jgi:hypothetical protein